MVIATFIISFISLCVSTYLLVSSKKTKEIPQEKVEEIKQHTIQDIINSYLYGDEQ